jgi:hypothetical protein
MDMQSGCLSALTRTLSTIDASNHMHHMELRANPPFNGFVPEDWAAWEEVHSVLAGPRFQFLRVLYINMEPASNIWGITWDRSKIKVCEDMAATLLATRGARVSFSENPSLTLECMFCLDDLWY